MGGLTSLLLLLCVGVTVSTVLDLQKRIIGGHDCGPTERQYHVKILDGDGDFMCGGSLLKNNWILTAAHCWMWGMKAVVGVHPGTSPGTQPGTQQGTQPVTVRITVPPVMHGDDENRIHDIMLLRLPPLPSHIQIKPVDLPVDCTKKPKKGDTVQTAGHAANYTGPNKEYQVNETKKLQCADIKLSDCGNLQNFRDYNELRKYDYWFCGQTTTVDISNGDSGGGVVVGNTIYGVNSFTGNATHAHDKDAAFMDVCEYKKWIVDTTK